jgi:Flp pilus assembly protein TadD
MLYNNLGISFFLKGDYEEAVRALSEAYALENSNEKIHSNLALALSKLKSREEVFEAFKKSGDEAPPDHHSESVSMHEEKVGAGIDSQVDTSLW